MHYYNFIDHQNCTVPMRYSSQRKTTTIFEHDSPIKQSLRHQNLNFKEQNRKAQKNYRFYVGSGNNAELIRKILSSRSNWIQTKDPTHPAINFRWKQTSKGHNYEQLSSPKALVACFNHYEHHQELSNKQKMLANFMNFCQVNKMNVFEFVPVTFVFNFTNANFELAQNNFIKFYYAHLPSNLSEKNQKKWLDIPRKNYVKKLDKKCNFYFCKPYLDQNFIQKESTYLWLIKPAFYNRGEGIHIFNNIRSLQNLINHYLQNCSIAPKMTQKTTDISQHKNQLKKFRVRDLNATSSQRVKTYSFIIQKYLERPFLIDGRKFDIRVWVLVTHEFKVFFYRQGYIRTSSKPYSVNQQQISDLSIHLTNNAIQKKLQNYGKYQQGNQLSFKHFAKYLTKYGGNLGALISEMKKIVKFTTLSTKRCLNRNNRRNCFELFGYDFMVDYNLKVWLIEVNTNPCLDQSSPVLEALLPKMLNSMFQITIDDIFKKPGENYDSEEIGFEGDKDRNLWDFIVDLNRNSMVL